MNKKIIFGTAISVLTLIMLPSVNAIEINNAVEVKKSLILEKIKQIQNIASNNKELQEKTNIFLKKINGDDINKSIIINMLFGILFWIIIDWITPRANLYLKLTTVVGIMMVAGMIFYLL
jgi:hypothetical protein